VARQPHPSSTAGASALRRSLQATVRQWLPLLRPAGGRRRPPGTGSAL